MGSVPDLTQEEVDALEEVYVDEVHRRHIWEDAVDASLKMYRRKLLDCPWLWDTIPDDICSSEGCGAYYMCQDIRQVMDTMILQDRRSKNI